MEGPQVLGIILFIYGVLTASSMLDDAKRSLAVEHLARLRGIERLTLVNSLGPVLPLLAGLGVVSVWQQQALGIAIAAILLTVVLLFARGLVHAQRMRKLGVPRPYRVSYRKAHAIRAVALAICASTLLWGQIPF